MKPKRLDVFNKCGGHCAYCGVEIDLCNMQIDHLRSRCSTGIPDDSIDNLLPACPICNGWKHCDNLETFRRSIEQQIRKCRDYSRNYRMAERYGLVTETKKPIIFYFESADAIQKRL